MSGGRGGTRISGSLSNHGRQIATGTVTADGYPRWVSAEFRSVSNGPGKGRDGIVDRGGKRMLGRQAVIDRQHMHVGIPREEAARLVMTVEVAHNPASAVEEHQQRSVR